MTSCGFYWKAGFVNPSFPLAKKMFIWLDLVASALVASVASAASAASVAVASTDIYVNVTAALLKGLHLQGGKASSGWMLKKTAEKVNRLILSQMDSLSK